MGHHDAVLILIAGVLLAAGILGALLADRMRVPALLLFLGLGMLAGSEGIGEINFANYELARTLGTIALVLILFEGGLTSGWSEIRPVLGTAASLATLGTLATALLAGVAAKWIFGLTWLEGMIVGAAIAATDSAAIFAVLRNSTLEKRLARSLEGESGMNDPVALLLVIGFIEWIQQPNYGAADMIGLIALKIVVGIVVGLALGRLAVWVIERIELPSDGIYPVATIAAAALAYGVSEVAQGSGLLAVYLTALALGSARIPAKRSVVSFHEGLGWVSQIGLFILLGLLVFPGDLGSVAAKGLGLSAVLIFLARPIATFAATVFSPLNVREKLMLGWAGLRGATPIWLATFPVVAGVRSGEEEFAIVFFVVVTSTLVQGASFEPLAKRLRLTTDEPALPRRLFESGRIREMGGDVVAFRLPPGAVAAGHRVRELELPREALVNVIVRDGHAIPPRGATELREGDELHVLVRGELRDQVEKLTERWVKGPLGKPAPPPLPRRAASQVFSVRPLRPGEDPESPTEIDGIAVVAVLRSRRDDIGAMAAMADGRYAVTSAKLVAMGGRRALAGWCEGRAELADLDPEEKAWLQEITGALIARGRRR
ncbi:MAG TPA: potassium/proton antiporter [Solirubrobacterales bacterium]|nr:potassium/proton antiporter [Solirubrobacterales bacterium]